MGSIAKYILLGLGILSNAATLVGFWMQYISAPSDVQMRASHLLLTIGAASSVIIYLIVAYVVIKPLPAKPENEVPNHAKQFASFMRRGQVLYARLRHCWRRSRRKRERRTHARNNGEIVMEIKERPAGLITHKLVLG